MRSEPKKQIWFFLDYGCCLWGNGCEWPYDDLLSPETCAEVEKFVREFDASYSYGLPPYFDFTAEDCRRFNQGLRHVLALILADTEDTCIICNDQMELTEDEAILVQFRERGIEFVEEWREKNYLWSQIQWDD